MFGFWIDITIMAVMLLISMSVFFLMLARIIDKIHDGSGEGGPFE